MQTRPLAVRDDTEVRRFHEVMWRAEKEDGRPWNSMWSYPELAALLREPTDEMRTDAFAAFDGDEMVGAGFVMLSLLDNTDKGFAFVAVEPEQRRRGIGTALLDAVTAHALAEGRTTLTGLAACNFAERETAPQMQFARRHGFQVAFTEVQRSLPLPVADAVLDEIDAETAPFRQGYEVHAFEGQLPDDLVESYCALSNLLVLDAPTGDMDFEEEALTPDIDRARRARDLRSGRTVLTALALHEGEVVAYSDLASSEGQEQAHQRGTLVHREHRGHRLGAAVKVANLRSLQARCPHVRSVETTNSEVNAQMVGINERLGFVPVSVVPNFVRRL
jgi:GNAT superfamily N-acetyltransferase